MSSEPRRRLRSARLQSFSDNVPRITPSDVLECKLTGIVRIKCDTSTLHSEAGRKQQNEDIRLPVFAAEVFAKVPDVSEAWNNISCVTLFGTAAASLPSFLSSFRRMRAIVFLKSDDINAKYVSFLQKLSTKTTHFIIVEISFWDLSRHLALVLCNILQNNYTQLCL